MPDRLTSEQIDATLRRSERAGRYNILTTVISAVSFALIVVLFMVWVVFGQATVQHQNDQILSRVDDRLSVVEQRIGDAIQQNTVGDRTIVCLLNVDPSLRTERITQLCVEAAKQGKSTIQLPK